MNGNGVTTTTLPKRRRIVSAAEVAELAKQETEAVEAEAEAVEEAEATDEIEEEAPVEIPTRGRKGILNLAQQELIKQYAAEGKPSAEIAEEFGVGTGTIARYGKKLGVEFARKKRTVGAVKRTAAPTSTSKAKSFTHAPSNEALQAIGALFLEAHRKQVTPEAWICWAEELIEAWKEATQLT